MPTQNAYHHGALRNELLAVAVEMAQAGRELTLRAVAREAGVSHAAPYHHFADRRALLAAVAALGMDRLTAEVVEAATGAGSDARRRLLESGVAYVRFALQQPGMFRLIFSAELADRSDLPDLQRSYSRAFENLQGMVGERLEVGTPGDEVRFWALRSWATAHGLANLLLDRQLGGARAVEDAEALARRVFLADLARSGR